MSIRRIVTVIIIFLISSSSYGFDSLKVKRSIWKTFTNDLGILAEDAGAYYTSPFRMKGTDFLYAGGFIGATAIMFATDRNVKKSLGRNTKSTYNHDFWDAPTAYGFVQYPSIFAGGLYTIGLFAKEEKIRVTGRLMLESLMYSGVTVIGLRYLTGRYRPYYSDDQYKFTWFQSKNDTQAFPSGHSTVAFATSTVLAEQIGTWWARVIFYGFAAMTAYARVINNQHWLSDVFVGSALGFGTGMFVVNRERQREKEAKSKIKKGGGLSFYPMFNGFGLTYRF